ncbi:M1 family aminopeptidase [Reichenbachiella sp. MSK19-1]|uniref:M1 family metallopeptidase n=1 Tax=Reichenbachiella sp. MSK19-1 TaxID=1897631 RepID=UPI000EC597C0|nr:M1 family aminopeptidase [Reichenbachiella sp. MSK19-1]RJE75470.1 hypothetical protein BGP76_18080 [Reichenbachiella sp. MSK19-1]
MRSILFWLWLGAMVGVSCSERPKRTLAPGVSKELADDRAKWIKSIHYDLHFTIPKDQNEVVLGQATLSFKIKTPKDLILDFTEGKQHITKWIVNGETEEVYEENEHLFIPSDQLKSGYNSIEIDFVAGAEALNRTEDYMYTLFVPNKASSAFPCFDQPNLKSTFSLSLDYPSGWSSMANAKVKEETVHGDQVKVVFEKTEAISTYLFAFVVGDFDKRVLSNGTFSMEVMHREPIDSMLETNLDEILRLHVQSLAWLESYTGIAYPFHKFGVSLIPGFQFGGMEHPGVIDYKASLLMLESSATAEAERRRAALIAHETAHMWFGNYVTMTWFDDVWMKEVFASFMADKIVAQLYPEVNDDLVFLYDHYPSAYAVDRTAGTVPIRQPLANLNQAANMYSNIIYDKAPIMMRQLEQRVGERVLQSALTDYLDSFSYSNADWEDLMTILQRVSGEDLSAFNQAWVYQTGMPFFELKEVRSEAVNEFDIIQHDPKGEGRVWPQYSDIMFSDEVGFVKENLTLDKIHTVLPINATVEDSRMILLNAGGQGYGVFTHGLGYIKGEFLFNRARVDLSRYEDDLTRGAAYINLHEYLLQEGFHPQLYFYFLQNYLREEKNEIIIAYLLSNLEQVYDQFFNGSMRADNVAQIESTLLAKLDAVEDVQVKTSLFNAYIRMASSPEAVDRMKQFWESEGLPDGIMLSSRQFESLALNIALKGTAEDESYIDWQIDRMDNEDRIKRLQFIRPAVSHDSAVRMSFFEGLKKPANRKNEPWVISALYYLHHPIRNEASVAMIAPSLQLLAELQQTGDIFFTKRWLDQTLYGYNSATAVQTVRDFIETAPLDVHTRNKLLQSSDLLFRSEKNLSEYLGE